MEKLRYNNLSSYLKDKYGTRLSKICIDGGFGCPNRDGKCGTGGCIYCGERGAGEHIDAGASIRTQAETALSANKEAKFIAYFQNFTNTYAPTDVLRERYDSALISDRIKILAIGTRPDCITEETAELIASYKSRVDVWVELGLQSSSDKTAEVINRGYKTEVYIQAAEILKAYGIPFVTHMIIGLPGECKEDVYRTVDVINDSEAWGVKMHSIYVMEGTRLAEMYRSGEYTPPSMDEYVGLAAECISRLRPDIIVHRITGDCPDGLLVAPEWNKDKNAVISAIQRKLEDDNSSQGSGYKK